MNIFKIYIVCVFIYTHNKYRQHTYIYKQKLISDTINRLTANYKINNTFNYNLFRHNKFNISNVLITFYN